ncbi:MAG TPA: hypothetical protein VK656_07685 [Candidatus Acidoferrum sp.]|nr:hypothetical protein [Candidatus Acidoferrum sp.]
MNIGFCGLDRARSPLHGDEIRSCWEPSAAAAERVGPVGSPDSPVSVADQDSNPPSVAVLDGTATPIAPAPRFDLNLFAEADL